MAQLSTKELAAIEDHLSAEKLLITKYKSYAQMCEEPQIKAKCEQLAGKHQKHHERLLTCVN